MPKAPLKAQIIIGLFAVLAIAYGFSIVRLDQSVSHSQVNVVPGQLLVVRMDVVGGPASSTDPWVVAPISTTAGRAYFVALRPGRAVLTATSSPPCGRCVAAVAQWSLEVRVWPSG